MQRRKYAGDLLLRPQVIGLAFGGLSASKAACDAQVAARILPKGCDVENADCMSSHLPGLLSPIAHISQSHELNSSSFMSECNERELSPVLNKGNDDNTGASSPGGLGPFDTGQLHQNSRFLAMGLWCSQRSEARRGRTDADH